MINDQRAAAWKSVVGLAKKQLLLLEAPVVQDVAHDQDLHGRERVLPLPTSTASPLGFYASAAASFSTGLRGTGGRVGVTCGAGSVAATTGCGPSSNAAN